MTTITEKLHTGHGLLAAFREIFGHKPRGKIDIPDYDLLPFESLNGHLERDIGYHLDGRKHEADEYRF
ncbi:MULTISPECIES: hypothetical protein [unclassified Sinorhizobium]|uniref:hypothetical protein n=1 Tax=unclassified Sinorhizobium TaxID=2613772 RepID=UPI0035267769